MTTSQPVPCLATMFVSRSQVRMLGWWAMVSTTPRVDPGNVGFAFGAGADISIESAEVVLMKSNRYDAIELLLATVRKMHQNLL